jgi:hypothetical protein
MGKNPRYNPTEKISMGENLRYNPAEKKKKKKKIGENHKANLGRQPCKENKHERKS